MTASRLGATPSRLSRLRRRIVAAALSSGILIGGSALSAVAETDPLPTTTRISCTPGQTYTGHALTPCRATVTGAGLSEVVPVVYSDNVDAGDAHVAAGYVDQTGKYADSHAEGTFTIAKARSSIDLRCPATVPYTGQEVEPCSAFLTLLTGTSSFDVRYTDNTGPGTAKASAQFLGDDNYGPSGQGVSFLIGDPTTVTVTCTAGSTYTGSALTPCTATATAADGFSTPLDVTYSSNIVAGTATATAVFPGDGVHLASRGSTTFTIAKAPSAVAVTCTSGSVYSGSPITPCTGSATGAGGLESDVAVTYTGNVDAGTATAQAGYLGDANHLSSSGSATFTIAPAPVTVTVTCPPSVDFTGLPLTPCTAAVTGPHGLAASLPVSYGGNTYAGTATATARYAGGGNYLGGTGTAAFRVVGFTLTGYSAPIAMSAAGVTVWNRVKAGSTVPLKFQASLPNGTPITSTATLGATFSATPVACASTIRATDVRQTSSADTEFRYDASSGQFVQNWKSPKGATGCYRLTTTTADHSELTAYLVLG